MSVDKLSSNELQPEGIYEQLCGNLEVFAGIFSEEKVFAYAEKQFGSIVTESLPRETVIATEIFKLLENYLTNPSVWFVLLQTLVDDCGALVAVLTNLDDTIEVIKENPENGGFELSNYTDLLVKLFEMRGIRMSTIVEDIFVYGTATALKDKSPTEVIVTLDNTATALVNVHLADDRLANEVLLVGNLVREKLSSIAAAQSSAVGLA